MHACLWCQKTATKVRSQLLNCMIVLLHAIQVFALIREVHLIVGD